MEMKKLPMLFFCFLLAGCSTMFNSGSQTIQVATTTGKEVSANITTSSGSYMTRLPTTIIAEPSTFQEVSVQVNDDCYDPIQINVKKKITPSYWANILNGWGFLIDPLTGAMWKYNNHVSVPVNKKKDAPAKCAN
jgi:hypothetical protein